MPIAILALLAPLAVAQQNAHALFERARLLEESNQDLVEAVALYQQAANESGVEKELAARAHLRIGLLYERMGHPQEARRVLGAMVSEFADQQAVASEARRRLAGIERRLEAEEMPPVTLRKLWSGPDVPGGEGVGITPDGRRLVYTDWETGNLTVRDLETGSTESLVIKSDESAKGWAEQPIVSPDGRLVAFSHYDSGQQNYDLRLTDFEGPARILCTDTTIAWTYPTAWTSDGKQVLAEIARTDETLDIALVDVETGETNVLKTLESGRWPQGTSMSPDRRYIVYSLQVEPGSDNWDINILPTDGGRDRPLVQHPAEDYVLGWSPDGRFFLFASARFGVLGLYLQRIEGATVLGEPELVKADMWRVLPLGFSSDGTFYFSQDTSVRAVYLGEVVPETGEATLSPAPVEARYQGPTFDPAFSPDGAKLAYTSEKGPSSWWYTNRRDLKIRSLESGEVRQVPLDPEIDPMYANWLPSSDSLLLVGSVADENVCLNRVDVVTGEAVPWECREDVRERGPGTIFGVAVDGRRFYYTEHLPDGQHIIERRPDDNSERELHVTQTGRTKASLSHDGSWIAFIEEKGPEDEILVMPSSGGKQRHVLYAPTAEHSILSLAITPDNRHIIYAMAGSGQSSDLFVVPFDGGTPRRLPIDVGSQWILDLTMHPDGRRVAFEVRSFGGEIWAMEGLGSEE